MTATDTGVGKTVLAAAILAALRARGLRVQAVKPVITGLDEPPDGPWPADDELLGSVTGQSRREVSPLRFGPAVSPHLAAELAGAAITLEATLAPVRRALHDAETVVVEGVGGLLVPLGDGFDVRALAAQIGLPVVLAARAGLGTINHTLLSIEAARAASLPLVAVVLTPWPRAPSQIELSNRATIEQLGQVTVSTLREIPRPRHELLAAAGEELPLDRWLGPAVPSAR
ncbi:MAG: dethiobiotin synthase [Solirubrobacteraceae bacterium]